MTAANQKSARELIADLCDGLLQPEDRVRLTGLLREDPLLQNEYLDQTMVDGLLRYELGVDRPTIPSQFVDSPRNNLMKLTLGTLVVALMVSVFLSGYWWFDQNRLIDMPIQLSDYSFERDLDISATPILSGWYGDEAKSVTGEEVNLAPHGNRMLQFVRSLHQPSNECELYQLIDLSAVSNTSRRASLFLEAKMVANARASGEKISYLIALELYTYSELPELDIDLAPNRLGKDVRVSSHTIAADSDPESWQEVKLVMPLPNDARYGIVKISARESGMGADDTFKEVFVDNVRIRMTNKEVF
ncbi:MAG: hypothetical protein MUC43_10895 [Pirellula sp.]|jgi:hypothetical protein|nr:hypothetical protein [Pirellula sp.]